jgi:hypothetical protein
MLLLAQTNSGPLQDLGGFVIEVINDILVPIVFSIAFLVFVWGAAKYFIFSGASDEGKEQGRSLMIWGIIAFFVMVAVWGIVNLLVDSTGLNDRELDFIPEVPDR